MNYTIEEEWIHLQIDESCHGKTIVQWLEELYIGKKSRYFLFLNQDIVLDHQKATPTTQMISGQRLSLRIFQSEDIDFVPDNVPLSILYEDEFILAVSKPCGIIVHPDDKSKRNTLANAVAGYYQTTHQQHTVRYLHRLDENTSGIVLFSKCPFFQPWLDHQLAQKEIQRIYLAVVQKVLRPQEKWTVNQPIARDRHDSQKMRVSPTGKQAVTHFEVIKVNPNQHLSLLQCQLETGRTHQIRVHLAYQKTPLVNDSLYSAQMMQGRMMLHSWKCRYQHPLTHKIIEIEDKIPKEFLI